MKTIHHFDNKDSLCRATGFGKAKTGDVTSWARGRSQFRRPDYMVLSKGIEAIRHQGGPETLVKAQSPVKAKEMGPVVLSLDAGTSKPRQVGDDFVDIKKMEKMQKSYWARFGVKLGAKLTHA
jgi:hypothetical protein